MGIAHFQERRYRKHRERNKVYRAGRRRFFARAAAFARDPFRNHPALTPRHLFLGGCRAKDLQQLFGGFIRQTARRLASVKVSLGLVYARIHRLTLPQSRHALSRVFSRKKRLFPTRGRTDAVRFEYGGRYLFFPTRH